MPKIDERATEYNPGTPVGCPVYAPGLAAVDHFTRFPGLRRRMKNQTSHSLQLSIDPRNILSYSFYQTSDKELTIFILLNA